MVCAKTASGLASVCTGCIFRAVYFSCKVRGPEAEFWADDNFQTESKVVPCLLPMREGPIARVSWISMDKTQADGRQNRVGQDGPAHAPRLLVLTWVTVLVDPSLTCSTVNQSDACHHTVVSLFRRIIFLLQCAISFLCWYIFTQNGKK